MRNAKAHGLVKNKDVTSDMIKMAEGRIESHLQGMRFVEYNLKQLLINVYLQGARDMGEAVIAKGWVEPTPERKD